MKDVLAVILAGGKGSRLEPLTRDRAKPAVPFGGAYRIIDFTLSNCLNSGIRKMLVLTQYKAMSLDRHINMGWQRFFCRELGEFADVVPPQQRVGEDRSRAASNTAWPRWASTSFPAAPCASCPSAVRSSNVATTNPPRLSSPR